MIEMHDAGAPRKRSTARITIAFKAGETERTRRWRRMRAEAMMSFIAAGAAGVTAEDCRLARLSDFACELRNDGLEISHRLVLNKETGTWRRAYILRTPCRVVEEAKS